MNRIIRHRTQIAAHRAGALLWAENSATAFHNCTTLGVDLVEFDVQLSRDGELVVFHDWTLDRTTDGFGTLAELDWATLSTVMLNGTDGEGILRLDEVIDIMKPSAVDLRLEIKPAPGFARYQGIEDKVLVRLADREMLDRTVITSFRIDVLADVLRAGRAQGSLPRSLIWLVGPQTHACIGGLASVTLLAREFGVGEVGLHSDLVDAAAVDVAAAEGMRLGAWFVHEADVIERMLRAGVTTFTSDRPDLALQIRDRVAAC